MKSVVALFLVQLMLGSSLLPGFGIDQSARWAELIHHYQHHRVEDTSLGFVDFLLMHYDTSSEHQKHPNHCHHNLPSAGHFVSVPTPSPLRLDAEPPAVSLIRVARATFFRKADLYAFAAIRSLINPPRR
ncbi:hypothetical protein [Fibrella aestuarina]|nr:hypothetical protein [Fibrella aestuarina]